MEENRRPDRDGLVLMFEDDFDGPALDLAKWIPYYIPHWSSRERARPHYAIADSCLTLRIDPGQEPWCPEFDGDVKVSSIQTGLFAGSVGGREGQLRFNPNLVVREAQETQRLFLPQHGVFELRARADMGPHDMVALWMIGLEDEPQRSGEITIMEIFARNVTAKGTRLGHGIKQIHDPKLAQDFEERLLPFMPGDWHTYAAEWTSSGVDFYLDDVHVRHVAQSPDYPMQVMLNIYELPGPAPRPPRTTAGSFTIDWFRGYTRG
jgi:hypothetical protein